MNNPRLDPEEAELLDSIEAGEWESVPAVEAAKERHRDYARATLKKDRRVNIRISSQDLEELQELAVEEGIPYQTLMGSVLHKYVSGRLVERPERRRLARTGDAG